jgi:hypothetical protein
MFLVPQHLAEDLESESRPNEGIREVTEELIDIANTVSGLSHAIESGHRVQLDSQYQKRAKLP